MMSGLSRYWPKAIAGQIIALVICAVVSFQLVSGSLFALFDSRREPPGMSPPAMAGRVADFAALLDDIPAIARPDVVAAVRLAYPGLDVRLVPASAEPNLETRPSESLSDEEQMLVRHISRVVGAQLSVGLAADRGTAPETSPSQRIVSVRLKDGSIVTAKLNVMRGPPPSRTLPFLLVTIGLTTTMLFAFLWWAARTLTAPLARFATVAEEFSLEGAPAPLSESNGPSEIRTASRALNRMQARVRKMIEDRTRMLAAVSHDLRTPITRLRLRAEFIEQDDTRTQMLQDLEQMERMVHGVVSYLRDGSSARQLAVVDLGSVVQTVCDHFADFGGNVALTPPPHLRARANADELQRALANLIDNALKYGGSANVSMQQRGANEIEIDVSDSGPGIADAHKAAMLQPFARGDASRNLNDKSTGFGLGLAIVNAVARNHGGRLELRDNTPAGLIARLVLPAMQASIETQLPAKAEAASL